MMYWRGGGGAGLAGDRGQEGDGGRHHAHGRVGGQAHGLHWGRDHTAARGAHLAPLL